MRISTTVCCLIAALAIGTSTASAQVVRKDLTGGLKKHMEKHYLDFRGEDGPTVIKRHRPKGPGGIRLPGWEDRAQGWAKIDKLEKIEGKVERITIPEFDVSFVTADFKMVWHYSGESSCDRISSPGGATIDHPWGKLHPTGRITLHLRIEKQKNGKLTRETYIEPGHGDRPNGYLRNNIAPQLADKAEQLMQDYLGVEIEQ